MSGLRLGTFKYMKDNPERIAIFNSNYDEGGAKIADNPHFHWKIQQGYKDLGGGFPSYGDARDWLREYLANQLMEVS